MTRLRGAAFVFALTSTVATACGETSEIADPVGGSVEAGTEAATESGAADAPHDDASLVDAPSKDTSSDTSSPPPVCGTENDPISDDCEAWRRCDDQCGGAPAFVYECPSVGVRPNVPGCKAVTPAQMASSASCCAMTCVRRATRDPNCPPGQKAYSCPVDQGDGGGRKVLADPGPACTFEFFVGGQPSAASFCCP